MALFKKSQKYACNGKIGNIFMLYRSIESPFYLLMLLADFFPIAPCFFSRAIFIAFMRCKSCVAASKPSSDIDVGKIFDWHERRMHPDYSHYFSRFIGKSHCRVIIITIVTFERAFRPNAALFYISNSNMSAHFFSFFLSVWPKLHLLERCRKRLSE